MMGTVGLANFNAGSCSRLQSGVVSLRLISHAVVHLSEKEKGKSSRRAPAPPFNPACRTSICLMDEGNSRPAVVSCDTCEASWATLREVRRAGLVIFEGRRERREGGAR